MRSIPAILGLLLAIQNVFAQTFIKVTDTSNPIVADNGVPGGSYSGASWIDYDGDGDDDLFVNLRFLYRNDGNGQFTRLNNAILNQGVSLGNSWADYDNDGDMDLITSGVRSFLYRNDGNDAFTKITTGDIADSTGNAGWGCAWADYDNDSFTDLIIVHASGFLGTPLRNHVFHNDANGSLVKQDLLSLGIDTIKAPYTVPSWSDFDDDGDMDLFIGSGPANGSPGPDYMYENLLSQGGPMPFERYLAPPVGSELRDGQIVNWIDYDNDRDLDVYITNYAGRPNDLYRNEGGTFVKMTSGDVGPLVADGGANLASVWADFDNDGDMDVFITRDNAALSRYYVNNGNGTFSRIDTSAVVGNTTRYGATAGDYDNDGDMDLFAVGAIGLSKALFRNETGNQKNWIHVRCSGDPTAGSNRAAIGAKVRSKATIEGTPVWQLREISAQNSFNSHNSLRVHFGLGNATVIDSLVIEWPSDSIEVYTNLAANHIYTMTEGQGYTVLSAKDHDANAPGEFHLQQNFPNPFNPATTIRFRLDGGARVQLKVYNMLGQEVRTLVHQTLSAGEHSVVWDGRDNSGITVASGVYIYRLTNGLSASARKMVFMK